MQALPATEEEEEHRQALPTLTTSWKGNPLEHRTRFEPGDAIRATDASNGLTPGEEYPILGYWYRVARDPRETDHMYVYLRGTANGHLKDFRCAVEEERTHEEVLFCLLPTQITELCIQDCLKSNVRHRPPGRMQSLEYVAAMDSETIMRCEYGGLHEKGQVQRNDGQFFIPFVA